ncbi:Retrovirus-related Pol polyprotein from transposon TNT 1-94 [Vitis vinifera]|uniref:Retrovirus-related Pol polyprotein from transposon TNT 1-94 n=1 Tax=Vitis vinifera TaxID=29760 RepID=A0A438CD94_VITVI|nr:Retrovirus-related Pol polyprotein from transposon TNT 1-94 [Vitis vinifera]
MHIPQVQWEQIHYLGVYVDDILLASSDVGLLHETKRFLSSKFDMKDLGNASFVLGIQIYRDRSRGDKFSLHQCPKNELEKKDMERFPYASAIGSLMYAQVCTRPDIAYIVGMLGRYLSNQEIQATSSCWWRRVSWKSVKQTLIASSTMEAEFIACYEHQTMGYGANFITQLRIVDD